VCVCARRGVCVCGGGGGVSVWVFVRAYACVCAFVRTCVTCKSWQIPPWNRTTSLRQIHISQRFHQRYPTGTRPPILPLGPLLSRVCLKRNAHVVPTHATRPCLHRARASPRARTQNLLSHQQTAGTVHSGPISTARSVYKGP
jgi:hypothetical protein